jgi:hypothetical protein
MGNGMGNLKALKVCTKYALDTHVRRSLFLGNPSANSHAQNLQSGTLGLPEMTGMRTAGTRKAQSSRGSLAMLALLWSLPQSFPTLVS